VYAVNGVIGLKKKDDSLNYCSRIVFCMQLWGTECLNNFVDFSLESVYFGIICHQIVDCVNDLQIWKADVDI
jgi:hypothetical protein